MPDTKDEDVRPKGFSNTSKGREKRRLTIASNDSPSSADDQPKAKKVRTKKAYENKMKIDNQKEDRENLQNLHSRLAVWTHRPKHFNFSAAMEEAKDFDEAGVPVSDFHNSRLGEMLRKAREAEEEMFQPKFAKALRPSISYKSPNSSAVEDTAIALLLPQNVDFNSMIQELFESEENENEATTRKVRSKKRLRRSE